jgi:ubiquinone/menaquinone biosynthesis C-methylase UbiE
MSCCKDDTQPNMSLHYQEAETSRAYVDSFTQKDSYMSLVSHQIVEVLGLESSLKVRLIDLGGGTGKMSELLFNAVSKQRGQVVCVDRFEAMLAVAKQRVGVETLLMDAVHFSSLPNQSYSHVLLKEMVHLVPTNNMEALFSGLHRQLEPGGKMLIVTRPVEVFLPFPERVREIWRTTQPTLEFFCEEIKRGTGLDPVVSFVDCRVSVTKTQWLAFLRSRTWSEFSILTENEMEEGIQEVSKKYFDGNNKTEGGEDKGESISIVDRLVFILTEKTDAS